MSYVLAIGLLILCLWVSRRAWDRYDLQDLGFSRRQFRVWIVKGIAVPVLLWMLMNFGISVRYPPVLASVEAAKEGGGKWVSVWLGLMPPTVFVVGTFWAAATYLWLLAFHAREMESSRADFIGPIVLWGVLLSPVLGLLFYLGGWWVTGVGTVLLLIPVLRDLLALGNPRQKKFGPVYARAVERVKAGNYGAAEREVLRQLEKCDSDFAGWMMLAELYANQFKDLAEADRLVHQVCRQEEITRDQMCEALHRLATWHIQFARDPVAACAVLQEICEAFPATHYGDTARKRIRQLSAEATLGSKMLSPAEGESS